MSTTTQVKRLTSRSRETRFLLGIGLMAAVTLVPCLAMAWTTMNIPGTWDAFNAGDTAGPFRMTKVSPPGTPAGMDWYTNVMYVAASGGDVTNGSYQLKLAANGAFTFNWGGPAVNIDATTALTASSAGNATITLTNGFYYSFRTLNPPTNATATLAVMKTTNPPISVKLASQVPPTPRTNDSVTLNINLSAPKSPEETIYVRWTTNAYAASTMEACTSVTPTNYTATIPPEPDGTAVSYYILTTTAAGITPANADSLTLALDSNGGNNYAYTTYAIPWPGFGYPSDPATNIHHWKEEAVVGNGFINGMLDQNGALYDLYYPSVGARHGVGTSNEGYRGPEQFPNCPSLDQEANGQMNLIAAQGGIGISAGGTNSIYWLQNTDGTDYIGIGQQWDSDSVNVVLTSNTLVAAGNNIQVVQYDFCPTTNALPLVTDGTRTNYGVYIKRFLLTNNQASTNTIDFYYDANFNINGGNQYDQMFWDTSAGGTNYDAMVAFDNTGRIVPVQTNSCDPNGYTTEYSPPFAFPYVKSNSLYFATAMKLVTNIVTGAGSPADGSWRDITPTDDQEGWIGKRLTLAPGVTNEVDVLVVGSWDDFAGATGTYQFWGRPMVNWFYNNNMATAQAATETYWSNWLAGGVTVNLPSAAYNKLFKRSLLITALHCDTVSGAIIAGMHNGAYPFCWPRDGVYAAVTLDRTGHPAEAVNFYRWLRDIAYRNNDINPTGVSFFFQKYNTDGYPVWTAAQLDETASVPWGLYYHYLISGDNAFVSNYWNLARQSGYACSWTSEHDASVYFDASTYLLNTESVWEDSTSEFLYSNASIVRGCRDAANMAQLMGLAGPTGDYLYFTNESYQIQYGTNGVGGTTGRILSKREPADISQLGPVIPFEIYSPADPLMTNIVERITGRQASFGFQNSLVETDSVSYPDIVGLVNRYVWNVNSNYDNYWNTAGAPYGHSPWFLATSWFGEYFARWQDYTGGKAMINTNKYVLDLLVNKLGPLGLASEQIAPTVALQKYPGFWLQTAWPNVWESHSTLIDQMMMFLDFKPEGTNGNNTCYFAPKLPVGWNTMTFNNMVSQGQQFDITVAETGVAPQTTTNVIATINKHTTGSLNFDIYLRTPTDQASNIYQMVVVNNTQGAIGFVPGYTSSLDASTGRVHVQGPLTFTPGINSIAVYPDTEGKGVPDYWKAQYGYTPSTPASTIGVNGQTLLQSYTAGLNPNNPNDGLHIIQAAQTALGQPFQAAMNGHAGRVYILQRTTDLTSSNWVGIVTNGVLAADGNVLLADPNPPVPNAFYRFQVNWP